MSESSASQSDPSAATTNGAPPPPRQQQQMPPSLTTIPSDDDLDAVDLDAVPGQIGHAVLRASDGTVVRGPTGSLTERDADVAYRMMLEIGTVLDDGGGGGGRGGKEGGFRRLTVGFRNVTYAVALGGGDDGCLYVVKRRSSP